MPRLVQFHSRNSQAGVVYFTTLLPRICPTRWPRQLKWIEWHQKMTSMSPMHNVRTPQYEVTEVHRATLHHFSVFWSSYTAFCETGSIVSDVVEKITTRRREGVGVVVEKNCESRRTFNKNSCILVTAITHTEILVAGCIFLIKSVSD